MLPRLDLLSRHAGHQQIGIDKIQPAGLDAIRRAGLSTAMVEVTERTRGIKTEHELRAVRCAIHSCERAMAVWKTLHVPKSLRVA